MKLQQFCWLLLLITLAGCDSSQATMDTQSPKYGQPVKNQLAEETSPYLLQHQYNPVQWRPWSEAAFDDAKAQNKLVLVSIGYSACHWCHVMEHESFEDDSIAAIMNEHFVCIKVDREERPDVDQVYMNAVQLMTGRGGWPLNCFTLPDGRPVYGGTYFPKEDWGKILAGLAESFTEEPKKFEEYATQLTEGVAQSDLISLAEGKPAFSVDILQRCVDTWKGRFDNREGGPNRSPKFPLPNNYQFLLQHGHLTEDEAVLEHVYLTLDKMAMGGIYDQLAGGFSRYSTDLLWKAPHFEKMLYDNAQLMSLYSEAYQASKKPLYKDIVYQTFEWLQREMLSDEGAYYSALDADSEGEEGLFYVWKEEELRAVLGSDFDFAKKLYNVNAQGRWEHERYILLRDLSDKQFAKSEGLTLTEFAETKARVDQKLMERRATRERPGLDDKSLTSWNALMISGLVSAALSFDDDQFLAAALHNADFIWTKQRRADGGLNHSYKARRSSINGYLTDYAFMAQACIDLYQATFDELWLVRAQELTDYAIAHFGDEVSQMFYFTSDEDPALIARKMEVDDNVIPASNSAMARVLFSLGTLYDRSDYIARSRTMLHNIKDRIAEYGSGYSNWASFMQTQVYPYYEIAIMGPEANHDVRTFAQHYIPNKIYMGANDGQSKLPLLEYKFVPEEKMIYVCVEKSCKLPVQQVSDALKQFD